MVETTPTRWVALLRGINVGGRHKLAMADVRSALTAAGLADVVTYIQSGNIVFTAQGPESDVRDLVRTTLEQVAGFEVPTVVLDGDALERVWRANPFSPAEPKLEHIVLHDGTVPDREREALAKLVAEVPCATEVFVAERAVYLHTPEGFSSSPLVAKMARVTSTGTARNLATVAKLRELVAAGH